jgi:hypothetical protein
LCHTLSAAAGGGGCLVSSSVLEIRSLDHLEHTHNLYENYKKNTSRIGEGEGELFIFASTDVTAVVQGVIPSINRGRSKYS